MLFAGRALSRGLSRGRLAVMMAFICTTSSGPMAGQVQPISLSEGWRFRAVASAEHPEAGHWRGAIVPGVVETDLQCAGVIPDDNYFDLLPNKSRQIHHVVSQAPLLQVQASLKIRSLADAPR
jgi:hypothetical protein